MENKGNYSLEVLSLLDSFVNKEAVCKMVDLLLNKALIPFTDFDYKGDSFFYRKVGIFEVWTIVTHDDDLLFAIKWDNFVGFRKTYIHTENKQYPINNLVKNLAKDTFESVVERYQFNVFSLSDRTWAKEIRAYHISDFSQMLQEFSFIPVYMQ